QPQSARLSAALFRRLDRNSDDKLSAAEMNDARERLAFFDSDEDECISTAELLGRVEDPTLAVNVMRRAPSTRAVEDSPNLFLLEGDAPTAAKQLLSRRGTGRTPAIRLADFGPVSSALAAFDKNRDGRLDGSELQTWLSQPTDLELVIDSSNGRT